MKVKFHIETLSREKSGNLCTRRSLAIASKSKTGMDHEKSNVACSGSRHAGWHRGRRARTS
jgi:hypothetical protein